MMLLPHVPASHARAILLALVAALAFANPAQAVLTVTFSEVGDDVIATLSGSLDLTTMVRAFDDVDAATTFHRAGLATLGTFVAGSPSWDRYDGGERGPDAFDVDLRWNPDSWSGASTFALLDGSNLAVAWETPANASDFTPTGTWTWEGRTFDDIFVGSISTTPSIVFELGVGGDTIQYVEAPEPSSALLSAAAVSVVLAARRRGRRTTRRHRRREAFVSLARCSKEPFIPISPM